MSPAWLLDHPHGVLAVLGQQDPVAQRAQRAHGYPAHQLVVLHHQDGLAPARDRRRRRTARRAAASGSSGGTDVGQIDREGRALPGVLSTAMWPPLCWTMP